MSTATEVKLLTLLNVTAIKRPMEQDVPGGHRGAPSLRARIGCTPISHEAGSDIATSALVNDSSGSSAVNANGSLPATGSTSGQDAAIAAPVDTGVKRRKSVVFGGEVGPSGSSYSGPGKRKRAKIEGEIRVAVPPRATNGTGPGTTNGATGMKGTNGDADLEEGAESSEGEGPSNTDSDLFNIHFGVNPPQLASEAIKHADNGVWSSERRQLNGFGRIVELQPGKLDPEATSAAASSSRTRITPSLVQAFRSVDQDDSLVKTALTQLGTYKDLYLHSLDGEADGSESKLYGEHKEAVRKAAVVHALNHVLKTRRKIIRNNEKLAHAAAQANGAVPDPPQDQSFTRPKILLLLPLRSLALHYLTAHLLPLAPPGTQIENHRPFISSLSIPADSSDPLASSSANLQYPIDHLINFRGNSDDNFRIGIKITRKAWRIVMMPANEVRLMDCDILIASPLGMKMQSEKEKSTDLLASIEVAVVDGVDVMMMQNWEHVQFLFSHMNKIPQSPHGCDFSRVKPWYLDSQAKYIRQTIMLSRYDSPEARALFSQHCLNLAGKVRTEKADYEGVMTRVREGVKQVFDRVDLELKGGEGPVEEVEKRLEYFTKKTIPALLRSAVSRQNTLIIIPSYFDFVRITHYLRKEQVISFSAISEYSSNSEISRARTLFFKGKKPFLLMTERFHFYRRYRIRGAKTIVWYQPPEHAQFYSETLETPFLPSRNGTGAGVDGDGLSAKASARSDNGGDEDEIDVDEAEITSRVLWSRFDKLRLERLVGSVNWKRMIGSGEGRAEFI